MKEFSKYLKELFRDVRALGSWVFFFLFVARVLILPDRWPFLNQLLIAGGLVLVIEIIIIFFGNRIDIDYYIARSFVLLWFSSVFYDNLMFTWFVSLIFILMIFGSLNNDGKLWKAIIGLILGVVGVFLGSFV